MPTVDELDLPTFRSDDPEVVGDRFHAELEGLLEQHWLARAEPFGFLVLEREAVDLVLRTRHARMPAIELLELQGVTSGPMYEQLSGNLLNLHGEPHRQQRALVQPAFSPAAAERLRPVMRQHLAALLDDLPGDGRCDLVPAVAKPYPARMIAEIVGAPIEDAARLGEWAYWIQSTFDPGKVAGALPHIERAAAEFHDYVADLLTTGDASGDHLLGALRPALDDGRITEAECVSLVGSVLIGGVDTTQAQLAHTVRLLAQHPEQWEALVADPSLVPRAVEEGLRFEPIAPFTARLVTEQLDHDGVTFPPGTLLITCALTANRSTEVYASPTRFDITADRGDARALSFGAGPHFCLGHALARAELEEALAMLVERYDHLELTGPPVYDTPPGVYGLHGLPVRLG
jgi:cytochrome P450